jgi:hypothetical protein
VYLNIGFVLAWVCVAVAPRNVLVDVNEETGELRFLLCDFGLSKKMEAKGAGNSYYRQTSDSVVPFRWMSLEALNRKYSDKSDVCT